MVKGKTFMYPLVILFFLLSLAMVSVPLVGRVEAAPATYYVNGATGDDFRTPAEAQNPATPWQSIGHAVDTAIGGDTVIVAPGIYDAASGQAFPIYINRSLTLQSSGGAAVTTIDSNGSDAVILDLDDGDSVTFTGFTVTGGGTGISVDDDDGFGLINNVTITNNIVRDNAAWGIHFTSDICEDSIITVSNNNISNSGDDGIEFCEEFYDGSRGTVSGNTITDSDDDGLEFEEEIEDDSVVTVTNNNISDSYDFGIYVGEVIDNGQITIDGNTITDNWYGIVFYYEDTISGNARVTVNRNTISYSDEYGIYVESDIWDDSIVTITNNNISNSGYDGIEFCEDFNDRSRGIISGNTITDSHGNGLDFEEQIRDDSIVTVTGNTITRSCWDGLYFDEILDNSRVTVDGNNISQNGGHCAEVNPLVAAHSEEFEENNAEEDASPAPNNKADDEARDAEMHAAIDNGVDLSNGIHINHMDKSNQVTVSPCNLIFDNANFGLLNESGLMVNGELNWWGAANGPSGAGPGSGDKVSTNVDFEPWAVAEDCSTGGKSNLPPDPDVSPSNPNNWTRNLNPPNMSVRFVSVNPQQAVANQPVTISTNVVNTGDQGGNLNVNLKINGQVEETRMISVGPQASQRIKFTVAKSQPGTYSIDIGGQKASFIINGASSTTGKPVNGGVIAIIVACALVLTIFAVLIALRRPTS